MQRTNISAKAPRGRLSAKLLAGAVGLTMATFGGVVATALPASALPATVTTNSYTIGAPSGAVSGVTVTPTSQTTAISTGWVLKFTATTALTNSAGSAIYLTPTVDLSNTPTNVEVIDRAGTGVCFQSGSGGGTLTDALLTIDIASGCTLNIGDTVEVDFTAEAPASNFDLGVTTSGNATSAASNTVTITSAPPTLTAATSSFGANTNWAIAGVGSANSAAPWNVAGFAAAFTVNGTAPVIELAIASSGANKAAWVGSYSVTYTPSGGSAVAETVTATAGATTNIVYLTLGTPVAEGGTLSITANVTNPAGPASVTNTVTITPCAALTGTAPYDTFAHSCAVPATAAFAETTGTATFGTSASAVTVGANPTAAGIASQYTVGFKAGSAVHRAWRQHHRHRAQHQLQLGQRRLRPRHDGWLVLHGRSGCR